jgi:hypothetical protein
MKIAASIIAMFIVILFIWGDSSMWEDEKYAVYYIDGDVKLGIKVDDDGSFIGRVENNVIAVGSNEKYVVVKQLTSEPDVISYFVLDKENDNIYLKPYEVIEGPYTEPQFKKLNQKLDLPKFSEAF